MLFKSRLNTYNTESIRAFLKMVKAKCDTDGIWNNLYPYEIHTFDNSYAIIIHSKERNICLYDQTKGNVEELDLSNTMERVHKLIEKLRKSRTK